MNGKSVKIFFACAFGAGIGSLIALELGTTFWWVGMLAGGLVGYLSYEFKKVLVAIGTAWTATTSWRPRWKYIARFGRAWRSLTLGITALGFSAMSILVPLFWFAVVSGSPTETLSNTWLVVASLAAIFSAAMIVFVPLFVFAICLQDKSIGKRSLALREIRICGQMLLRNFNPIHVWFYVIPLVIKYGLLETLRLLRKLPNQAWRFTRLVFIQIHSDRRLICGLDAALGASVGFFAGSVLIGSIVGGLIGVLNYEIVSKRVLGLAPSRIKG